MVKSDGEWGWKNIQTGKNGVLNEPDETIAIWRGSLRERIHWCIYILYTQRMYYVPSNITCNMYLKIEYFYIMIHEFVWLVLTRITTALPLTKLMMVNAANASQTKRKTHQRVQVPKWFETLKQCIRQWINGRTSKKHTHMRWHLKPKTYTNNLQKFMFGSIFHWKIHRMKSKREKKYYCMFHICKMEQPTQFRIMSLNK